MDKFTKIDAYFKEGETTLVLNLKSDNLYEVRTVFQIESGDGFSYDDKPDVCFAGSRTQAAIGVGSVLHVINLEIDVKPREPMVFDCNIVASSFFANGRLLVVALEDGTVVFYDCSSNLFESQTTKLFISCALKSVIFSHVAGDEIYLVVIAPSGKALVARCRYYETFMNHKLDDAFCRMVGSAQFLSFHDLASNIVVSLDAYGLLSLPSAPGDALALILQEGRIPFIRKMNEYNFGVCSAAAYGLDMVILSDQNKLHYLDLITGFVYKECDIVLDSEFDGQITKFAVIDYKVDAGLENAKILLLLDFADRSELQIRAFGTNKVLYCVKTSSNVLILPFSTEIGNSVVFADPFSPKDRDSVFVRYIDEAHPKARLDKLLYHGRYDEAEDFAKMYRLNVERVYHARVIEMIETFNDNDENVDAIFHYCDLISDENVVADFCVWAINSFNRRPHIQKFLEYALKKNVTDMDTTLMIKRRHYDFATICAIASTNEEFHAEIWKKLVENEDAPYTLFQYALGLGELTSARILWSRYATIIYQNFELENRCTEFFDYLVQFTVQEPRDLEYVVEFVQKDFGVTYLLHANNDSQILSRGNALIDFTLKLVQVMEQMDPENFPENSFLAAGLMGRLLDNIRIECISCKEEAKVYKIFGILKVSSVDLSEPMGSVNIHLENLKKMLYLKKAYDCNLSYDEYVASDAIKICYGILGRFTISERITNDIKKVVFPYLKEFKLKPDETLLSYIRDISCAIGVTFVQGSTWDCLCIGITRCINSKFLRCEAILDIAKKSNFPWSPDLKKAVNEIIEIKPMSADLRKALIVQCQREELANLFLKMNISLNYLDQRISTFDLMSLFKAIFYTFTDNFVTGVAYCRQICDLLEVIQGLNMDTENIIAICMVQVAVDHFSEDNFAPLNEAFVLIKSNTAKYEAVMFFVQYVENFSDETHQIHADRRLALLNAGILLIDKFSKILGDVQVTRELLMRICKAQKDYDVFVTRSLLRNTEKLEKLVIAYAQKRSNSSFNTVLNLGILLGFTKSEASMLYSLAKGNEYTALYEALVTLSKCSDDLTKDDVKKFMSVKNLFCTIREYVHVRKTTLTSTNASNIINDVLGLQSGLQNVYLAACGHGMCEEMNLLSNLIIYISLFREMVICFAASPTKETSESDVILSNKEVSCVINEMGNRLGSMIPKEMATLYDPIECFRTMARIGWSVLDDEEMNENHPMTVTDDWLDALMTLKSHPYLEYAVRKLCPVRSISETNFKQNIFELCQKIVAVPKVDLPLVLNFIFDLNLSEIEGFIMDMHKWAKRQQNSRSIYYVARLAQIIGIIFGNKALEKNICETYKSAFWLRAFIANNISITNVDYPKMVQADFVAGLGNPTLFANYCHDYGLQVNECLISYGFDLLRLIASETDESRCNLICSRARAAFKLVQMEPSIFSERCFEIIDLLCPYTYEAVEVLLNVMNSAEPENQKIADYICLLNFLKKTERKSEYTDNETKWYMERRRRLGKLLKEKSDDDSDSQMEVDHEFIAFDEKLIDANEVMPKVSRKRLPLHLFLNIDGESLGKFIEPILKVEINLQRVKSWSSMIFSTKHICRISRSLLVANAIGNKVREVITNKSFLTEKETLLIAELINSITKKKNVLQQLATQINKLPLCASKIEVYKLLHQCALHLVHTTPQNPSDAGNNKEREGIMDMADLIRKYSKRLNTELLLDEHHITVDSGLLKDPEKLIQLIFAAFTDWNDSYDIGIKMKLAREVSAIHELVLDDILILIIRNYLNGGTVVGYLQPAITGREINENLLEEQNLFLPLPFNDVDVVRLSYILKELNKKESALMIVEKLLDDNDSTPALLQKLKLFCVFTRYLSNDKFHEYFQNSISNFGDLLSTLMLKSALKFCNMNMTLEEFNKMPPFQVVTMILNLKGGIKPCRETFQLAAALIIDNGITEPSLIDKVLQRLSQFKCYDSLAALLRYNSSLFDGKFIGTLPSYYAFLFNYKLDILKADNADSYCYRDLVYSMMPSPPAGKTNAFLPILHSLKKMHMSIARKKLHHIFDPFTIDIDQTEESSEKDLKPDFGKALTNIGNAIESVLKKGTANNNETRSSDTNTSIQDD